MNCIKQLNIKYFIYVCIYKFSKHHGCWQNAITKMHFPHMYMWM